MEKVRALYQKSFYSLIFKNYWLFGNVFLNTQNRSGGADFVLGSMRGIPTRLHRV